MVGFNSPRIADVFHPCADLQHGKNNLVIFAPEIGQAVFIAYPLGKDGSKIVAEGIKDYLRRRGVRWCCFCSLTAEDHAPVSCRIVQIASNGQICAFCHHNPSKCAFFMNISNIRETASLTSDYKHIATKRKGGAPDIEALLIAFKNLRVNGIRSDGVFAENYLGTPGHQMSGPSPNMSPVGYRPIYPRVREPGVKRVTYPDARTRIRPSRKLPGSYDTNHRSPSPDYSPPSSPTPARGPAVPLAGPSRIRIEDLVDDQPRNSDERMLQRLLMGEGLSKTEWEGLTEICTKCEGRWLATALRDHVRKCRGGLRL